MAGVEREDEFRNADDGVGTDLPPSSPLAPTPSKAKPAAATGGFGRRLLASIGLPTSLSAAIGRSAAPSGPKPPASQPPVGPNLGLGLLLHQGFNPSADGSLVSDASAGNLHLLPTADLQKRHEEGLREQGAAEDGGDQVIEHDVGVGEELAVLVLTEEEVQGKEDVADGCSGNRNGYSVQEDKEEEEHKGVELGAAMEDQEVMEQKVATKYYTAVEDQSNNDAEQCTGDSPTVIKDDSAVEEKEAAEQGCSVGTLVAAEDGIAGGLQEDGLVEGQCEDVISVHEQLMVVETSDELRVAMGDCWVHDQEEVVVEQEGETECFDAAVEDQSSNAALEQHDGDEFKDDNVVEDKDKAVEKEGAIDIQCAAEDGIIVRLQKEDMVVEDQGEDGICVQDQVKVVEQCMGDELGATMGYSAAHDQEVVVVEEGVTEHFDAAVEDQIDNSALENHTSYELRVIKDDIVVEDKDKSVEQEAAIGTLGAAEDGIAVALREEDLVVEGQGEHAISVKGQDNMVEQCMSDELGVGIGDSAVHDQEVMMVEQERLVECINAVMEDQCNDTAMEQCTSDELIEVKSGNVVEEKVKEVEQEGVIGLLVAAEDDTSVGEEDVLVEGQGKDGISVQDQHKVVDLCMSDGLGVSVGGSTIQYHDSVVDLEEVTGYFDAVVEDQTINAAVGQCTHDESKGSNFVEVKEKAVQQEVVIDIFDAAKDHVAVKLQKKKGILVEGQGEGEVSIQYQHKVMEQCTSDELEVAMGDSTVHDQEVGVEQEGITEHINAVVEDCSNKASMMQCTSDELSDIKDGNIVKKEKALDQEREFGIMGAAENSVAVGLQGESNMVVEGEAEDGISIQDQQNVLEQCMSDEPGVSMGDGVVQDQGVVLEGGVTEHIDAAVEDQSKSSVVEQCTSGELEAAKDDYFLKEKEKVMVEEGAIDILGSVKNDATVESQERREVEVLSEQGEDVVSLQDQCMAVEQCASDQVRTITDVNAAHDQEVVEQEGVVFVKVGTVDGIAIDAQEKAVEQSGGDESIATKDTEDKEQEVDQDGLIHKQDAIRGGSAVELQENEGVTVKLEGEDGISLRDQDKVVEQCTSDQWGTTLDDNAAEDQEVRREKIRLCVGYPQRPGRPNCRVYMSTGRCSYGLLCYKNHPPQLKAMPEVPSFPSEQRNHEVAQILELNRVGLPIRENARNCTFFMRNGTCKYGKRCCFNHPEHVLDVQLYKPTGWNDTNLPCSPNSKKSSPQSKKASEHVTLDDISSGSEILPPTILRMLLPPQTVPAGSEAKETKTRKDPDWSSASDDSDGDGCYSANNSGGPLCKQEHHLDYPERHDRQECPFLLKYGNCKFASSCQYYHPTDKSARKYYQKDPSLVQELMVYPDKPGAPECPFYMKAGTCKFGAECKFHHPKDLPPRGPMIPNKSVDANELHPKTKTTLQDHMDQQHNYPERPGQPECRYYMQFGKCKFLSACIFHHPKNRVAGMPECPSYMKTGTCQFGSACEFYHPKHRDSSKGGEIDDGIEYVHGYPERPGENECFSYMKHGYCRFQMNCRYHHPADQLSRK